MLLACKGMTKHVASIYIYICTCTCTLIVNDHSPHHAQAAEDNVVAAGASSSAVAMVSKVSCMAGIVLWISQVCTSLCFYLYIYIFCIYIYKYIYIFNYLCTYIYIPAIEKTYMYYTIQVYIRV